MHSFLRSAQSLLSGLAAPFRSGVPRKRKRDDADAKTSNSTSGGADRKRLVRKEGHRRSLKSGKIGKKISSAALHVPESSAPGDAPGGQKDEDATMKTKATTIFQQNASSEVASSVSSSQTGNIMNDIAATRRSADEIVHPPSKRARVLESHTFRRNTLDFGGSVPSGIMSSSRSNRPSAVEYKSHLSIPELTVSANHHSEGLSYRPPSFSSTLIAGGALQNWTWGKRSKDQGSNRTTSRNENSQQTAAGIAGDHPSVNRLPPIFSPSGQRLRAHAEQEYWQKQSMQMHSQLRHQRQQPNSIQKTAPPYWYPAPLATPFMKNVHGAGNNNRISKDKIRRQTFHVPSPPQFNGGLHLQVRSPPNRVYHDNHSEDNYYFDRDFDGRNNGNYTLNHSNKGYDHYDRRHILHNGPEEIPHEYFDLVREGEQLDRDIFYSQNDYDQIEHNRRQIINLRRKALAYKDKRNLSIPIPAPIPDSLLPESPQGLQAHQPSEDRVVDLVDTSLEMAAVAPHVIEPEVDRDAVNASDIAEYKAAVASNPDPFGLGSVDLDSAVDVAVPVANANTLNFASPSNFNSSGGIASWQQGFQFHFADKTSTRMDDDNVVKIVSEEEFEGDDDQEGESSNVFEDEDNHEYTDGDESEDSSFRESTPQSDDEDNHRGPIIAPPDITFDQPFTDEEFNFVAKIVLARAHPDDDAQISSHSPALFKIPISYKDYYTLTAGQWLNDEVINYYNSLQNTVNREAYEAAIATNSAKPNPESLVLVPPRCYWMKTDFYAFLNNPNMAGYDYDRVKGYCKKRNTKKFGINDLWNQVDLVFVPLNLSRMHWAMGVVNLRDHQFEMYDSMSSGDDQHLKRLQRWVIDEFKRIEKHDAAVPVSQWPLKIPTRTAVPQQQNGYDCGVFSTMFAKWLSQGRGLPFGFDQKNMMHFRYRIALDIWMHEMGTQV